MENPPNSAGLDFKEERKKISPLLKNHGGQLKLDP